MAKQSVGKVHTRVLFFMAQNPYTDRWEAQAYFPDLNWDYEGKMKVGYSHNDQHGPCCEAFILEECKVPKRHDMAAVARLKDELEHLAEPYSLIVMDSAEWMNTHSNRKREINEAVNSVMCDKRHEEDYEAAMA